METSAGILQCACGWKIVLCTSAGVGEYLSACYGVRSMIRWSWGGADSWKCGWEACDMWNTMTSFLSHTWLMLG